MSSELIVQLSDRLRFQRQRFKETLPSIPGTPYLFLSPFFLLFFAFLAFPIFYTVYLSFFTYQGVAEQPLFWMQIGDSIVTIPRIASLEFVGLRNYERLLSDGVFHQALFNTAYVFAIEVPLYVGLAIGLAVMLNAGFTRFKGVFRSIMLLPVSANTVAYSVVFVVIVAEGGLLDLFFQLLGLTPIDWLSNGFWSRNLMAFMATWRWTGYNMIIILAGLQTISESLYEAAEIDGASRFEKFRYVTIPQLKPVLVFVLVMSTIGGFKKFSEPTILIGAGAPIKETRTVVYYIYEIAFQNLQLGYGSALTVVLVCIVIGLSLIPLKVN
ncbi:carbohydrate ABC transporter permease [Halorarum halobium]|uniref:carbohydrate ABC transporter permease n=1 Tax=Halorarum halobium TaxID=3075121 RepID=UPI0028A5FF8A|nr:sugar ABC transporter permease [Halobaculum sp. XH14]